MLNANSRFSKVPTIDIQRSTFDMNFGHKKTFNAGKLYPFCALEVLPGDTFDWETAQVCRMRTPLFPTMDNAFLDYFYFFVPNRIIYKDWKHFLGESSDAWASDITYTLPYSAGTGVAGGLRDHFGLNANGAHSYEFSMLPLLSYRAIWNSWFRDQNLQDPVLVPDNSGFIAGGATTYDEVLPVNKLHDYFTSCLPAPLKASSPIFIPLGDSAPVRTKANNNDIASTVPITNTGTASGTIIPQNLYADLSASEGATINALRLAFATQKLLERDARGGTRYREIIYSHFTVTVPDASVQIPEYLAGERIPLNITTVLQTSSDNAEIDSPLGNTGAYSHTVYDKKDFVKSFTEHGWIIGVLCVRNMNSYSQGVPCSWSRKTRYDYFWPEFSSIGEKAVYNRELYISGASNVDNAVFGYQEAWAEYRYQPNTIAGEFKTTLRDWHYGDIYDSTPTLSAEWIQSDSSNIDRTLAVSESQADQFLIDMRFNVKATRPMPLYSVPGLIDHH